MNTLPLPDEEITVVKEKMTTKGCLWRMGCVVIWLPLILLPVLLFSLAFNGDVSLWHGAGFPESSQHPFLQARLLMEIDTRGVNITRSYIASSSPDDLSACVETEVRFLLWQGKGEPADYCDCYARETTDAAWTFQSQSASTCG